MRQHQMVEWHRVVTASPAMGRGNGPLLYVNRLNFSLTDHRPLQQSAQGKDDVLGLNRTGWHFRQ